MNDARDADPISRRAFSAGAAAVGVSAAATAASAQAAAPTMTDVKVPTPDGTCDAALFRPAGQGSAPGVIIVPDALGLRAQFRDMGRRLAGEGYAVLVVNPYYRIRPAPVIEGPFDITNPADRAKLGPLMGSLTPEGVSRDSVAFVRFLDAQAGVAKAAKIGIQGYCMGGAISFRAAAANPERIGALASFHGGGLVTDKPDSPHRLVPTLRAEALVAVAADDDVKDPAAKDTLRAAFAAADRTATVEVYEGARHGWCVPGAPAYEAAAAERAWSELLALYKRALV